MIAATTIAIPYIKVNEDVFECSYQSLEVVNTIFVSERLKISKPQLSKTPKKRIMQIVGKGNKAGFVLCRFLLSRPDPEIDTWQPPRVFEWDLVS